MHNEFKNCYLNFVFLCVCLSHVDSLSRLAGNWTISLGETEAHLTPGGLSSWAGDTDLGAQRHHSPRTPERRRCIFRDPHMLRLGVTQTHSLSAEYGSLTIKASLPSQAGYKSLPLSSGCPGYCERLAVAAALRWLYYHPQMSHTHASTCTLYSSSYAYAHMSFCCYSPAAVWLISFILRLQTVSPSGHTRLIPVGAKRSA